MVWVKAGEWNMQGTTQEEKMKSDYAIENPPKNGRDTTKYFKKNSQHKVNKCGRIIWDGTRGARLILIPDLFWKLFTSFTIITFT